LPASHYKLFPRHMPHPDPSPIGPALKYGAWKERKEREIQPKVKQIFRTRA